MWITFLLWRALRKMVTNNSTDKEQDLLWHNMSIKWLNTHKNTIEWQEHQMHCPFVYCTNRTCFQLTWWNAVLGSGGKEIVHQKPYYVYKMPKNNQWENLNTMVSNDGLWSRKEIQFVSSQTRKRIKNFNTWTWILDSGSVHNRDVIHKRENWTKVVPQVDIVFFFLWI